jgi:N-acetylglucosamine kinase-like BadF-type ATPase
MTNHGTDPSIDNYYLGVDTGATKTHAVITDRLGNIKAFVEGGPGNPQSIGGYSALERLLSELIRKACGESGIALTDIRSAGLGLAGYDWPSRREHFYQIALGAGLPERTELVNDAGLGIHAGTKDGWGICVAAGTSFNCRGRGPDGRDAFAIGDGMRWGEGAGALELALKSAQAVIAQYTMSGPETRLTRLFLKTFGSSSLDEMVEGSVTGKLRVTAALAPLIIETAQQDDDAARQAVQWAAESLANLTKGAIRQLGLVGQHFEVVLSGSFFKAGEIIIAPMKKSVLRLAPYADFHILDLPPVCGGVLLAMEADRELTTEERKEVKQTMRVGFEKILIKKPIEIN